MLPAVLPETLPEMLRKVLMRESLCYRLHYKTPRFRATLYRCFDIPERAQLPRRTVTGW